MRLLVASRTPFGHAEQPAASNRPVGLAERCVGALNASAAVQLVQAVAPDLSNEEAEALAGACRGVPLVLCLAADACTAGRLTVEVRLKGCTRHKVTRCPCLRSPLHHDVSFDFQSSSMHHPQHKDYFGIESIESRMVAIRFTRGRPKTTESEPGRTEALSVCANS